MPTLSDYGLSAGETDDIFMFWRHASTGGVVRRALVSGDYGTSKDYLERLLKRYFHAGAQMRNLATKLQDLHALGGVVHAKLGSHRLGLARPRLLNARELVDAADPPFLISREDDGPDILPAFPILAASRDDAAALVRSLEQLEGIDRHHWRSYSCERMHHPLHRLAIQARGGRVMAFPTELERQLLLALRSSSARRRRRAA